MVAMSKEEVISVGMITEDFILQNEGKLVWIQDDYLSMRYLTTDRKILDILEEVVRVKEAFGITHF
jgi:hypothetical protein